MCVCKGQEGESQRLTYEINLFIIVNCNVTKINSVKCIYFAKLIKQRIIIIKSRNLASSSMSEAGVLNMLDIGCL